MLYFDKHFNLYYSFWQENSVFNKAIKISCFEFDGGPKYVNEGFHASLEFGCKTITGYVTRPFTERKQSESKICFHCINKKAQAL